MPSVPAKASPMSSRPRATRGVEPRPRSPASPVFGGRGEDGCCGTAVGGTGVAVAAAQLIWAVAVPVTPLTLAVIVAVPPTPLPESTASTPAPVSVAVVGEMTPRVVERVTEPPAIGDPAEFLATTVTNAEPVQLIEDGATETVTVATCGVPVAVGVAVGVAV